MQFIRNVGDAILLLSLCDLMLSGYLILNAPQHLAGPQVFPSRQEKDNSYLLTLIPVISSIL